MNRGVDRVDAVLQPLRSRGGDAYLGEPVTQVAHACQTAALAYECGAADELVVAALLHDVGWLVGGSGHHGDHAATGADWLSEHFGTDVTVPVAAHVQAKRWLCSCRPGYADRLSEASRSTLARQGGAMTTDEARSWLDRPWSAAAVSLRLWDDRAKAPGRAAPGLDFWVPVVERVLSPLD